MCRVRLGLFCGETTEGFQLGHEKSAEMPLISLQRDAG